MKTPGVVSGLLFGIAAVTCLVGPLYADRNSDTQEDGLPKELDVLYRLTGRWRIEEAYPKSPDLPDGATGKGTAEFRKALGDVFLVGDYKSRCRELGTDVTGHSLFTFDQRSGQYRYWWFDNYGNANNFSGRFLSRKNTLVFTRKYADDPDDATMERHTFAFNNDDTVVFTMEFGIEPDYEQILTTTYTRKVKKSAEDKLLEKGPAKPKAGAVRSGM